MNEFSTEVKINLSTAIKEIATTALKSIQHISINGYKQPKEFPICCSTLKDYNDYDIRESNEHKNLFEDLKKITGPVLYFFEIVSDITSKEIVDSILSYRKTANSKAIPAIKKKYSGTKILYVGKVEKNFWGRVIQHLGFYKVRGTQGLQLFYWAKQLNLELKLTAIEFEKDAADLMPIFEKKLAGKLKPILGKHK